MKTSHIIFTSRIKELQAKAGVTDEEIVTAVGIDRTHLWRLKNKPQNPTLSTARAIATVLGASVEEVFMPLQCNDTTSKTQCQENS